MLKATYIFFYSDFTLYNNVNCSVVPNGYVPMSQTKPVHWTWNNIEVNVFVRREQIIVKHICFILNFINSFPNKVRLESKWNL